MDAIPDLATLSDDDLDRLIRETEDRGGRHLATAQGASTRASTSCAASVCPGCAARSSAGTLELLDPGGARAADLRGHGRRARRPRGRAEPDLVVALRRRAARGDPRARARGGRHLPASARAPRPDRHPARRAGAAAPRASRRPEGSRHDPRRPSMSHVYCPECGFQNPEASNYCARCGAYLRRDEQGETTLSLDARGSQRRGCVRGDEPRGPALVVRAGGGRAGESFETSGPRTLIGRSPECDVFLDDVTVSRRHAEIVHEGDALRDPRPRQPQRDLREPPPDRERRRSPTTTRSRSASTG